VCLFGIKGLCQSSQTCESKWLDFSFFTFLCHYINLKTKIQNNKMAEEGEKRKVKPLTFAGLTALA
jgi:hypothetical protein